MGKLKYVIVALLAAVAGFFCAGLVFDALVDMILTGRAQAVVAQPAEGAAIATRFLLPFVLTCAAIPLCLMIVPDIWRGAMVVILSLGGAGVALFVIHHRINATFTWYNQQGYHVMLKMNQLNLEIVPWAAFGLTVIGMLIQKMTHRELGPYLGVEKPTRPAEDDSKAGAEK
ncbi:MAG: hypothetical protein QGG42_15260 [Phycisphaerae bacterium]|jgi:hypothetical protein|nr:hypothetical protein [Phycisphaerae bacterium]